MKYVLFFLLLIPAFAACRSTSKASSAAAAADADVESKIVQLDPRVVGEGSARALQFTLQNTSEQSLTCAFTVDWFDAHGARVSLTSTASYRVELEARGSKPVRIAPMPIEASSWRLRFQTTER